MGKETEATYEQRQQRLSNKIIEGAKNFCDVVDTGLIFEREELVKAMDTFYLEKVDFVLCSFLSWAEDFNWIRFLRDMYPIPILLVSIIPDIEYTNTEYEGDFVQFLANGGLVGALEGSGSVTRFKRSMMKYSVGTIDQVLKETECFAKASMLRAKMLKENFGLLAQYNEVMWSTYIDP